MVLQAAPMSAMIFGHTVAGQQVTTTFDGTSYTTVADEDGVWRQQLPPTAASLKSGHAIGKGASFGSHVCV